VPHVGHNGAAVIRYRRSMGSDHPLRQEYGVTNPGWTVWCRSGVASYFLREMHARGEAEFGVDVGEVGLHGAR